MKYSIGFELPVLILKKYPFPPGQSKPSGTRTGRDFLGLLNFFTALDVCFLPASSAMALKAMNGLLEGLLESLRTEEWSRAAVWKGFATSNLLKLLKKFWGATVGMMGITLEFITPAVGLGARMAAGFVFEK